MWCRIERDAILSGVENNNKRIPRVPLEPTEQIAAVITGWAIGWTSLTLGMPEVPALLLGLTAWAATSGRYRRRWANPPGNPHPEPGS